MTVIPVKAGAEAKDRPASTEVGPFVFPVAPRNSEFCPLRGNFQSSDDDACFSGHFLRSVGTELRMRSWKHVRKYAEFQGWHLMGVPI